MSLRVQGKLLPGWWWTVDQMMLAVSLLLVGLGIVLSFAASPAVALHLGRLDNYSFVKSHIMFAALAIVIMITVSFFTPRMLRYSYFALACFSLILLIAVLFFGFETKGSTRWLRLFGLTIQPSEFLKPAFIVSCAWLLSFAKKGQGSKDGDATKKICLNRAWLIGWAFYAICCFLLIKEPDIGQAVLLTGIWCLIIFLAGANIWWLGSAFPIFGGMFYIIYLYSYHVHQRVQKFLTGVGDTFQVDMGKEAILHGSWMGVGPGEGTIKRLIPDSHTDFVFSVAAEEYGIIFCMALTLLYAFIVLKAMYKAQKQEDPFSRLCVMALAIQLGGQSFINIGVNLHLLPAKGMTLPFISYGGSSMLSVALSLGAILCLTKKTSQPSLTQRLSAYSRG